MNRLWLALLLTAPAAQAGDTWISPGLWEVRVTKQLLDGVDLTPQVALLQSQLPRWMASLPPEQRSQVGAMLGKQGIPGQALANVCVSPAMAAHDQLPLPPEANCEATHFRRDGPRVEFGLTCLGKKRTLTGSGDALLAGDRISARVRLDSAGKGGPHRIDSEAELRYLGRDCGDIKPADLIAKEWRRDRHR